METPIATNSVTLGRLLTRHARYRPSHTAVVIGDERLTYLQFNDFVNRWANALAALGVGRGDRVATILPNSLELTNSAQASNSSYWPKSCKSWRSGRHRETMQGRSAPTGTA